MCSGKAFDSRTSVFVSFNQSKYVVEFFVVL